MREALALVKIGIPFDIAFSVDATTRLAWIVANGELEGHEYNWHAKRWREK